VPIGEVIIPVEIQETVPEIRKTLITRQVDHGRGVHWGRSILKVDDCAEHEEDATTAAECG